MEDNITTAFNSNLLNVSYDKICKRFLTDGKDVLAVLTEKKEDVLKELQSQLRRLMGLKWYIAVKVTFTKFKDNEEISTTPTFHGKTRALLSSDNPNEQYLEALNKIMENMAKWISEGSGWTINNVEKFDLCIIKYKPFQASSYIPTPKMISHPSKGIINIKNEDEKCFLYCILAHLYPDKHRHNRVDYYGQFECNVNMTGIKYPVKLTDIDKFEQLNSNISLNVFGYESDNVYPLRITKLKNRATHINLLLLVNGVNTHYCLITNLSRLLSHITKHRGAAYYCNFCLHRFSRSDLLIQHEPLCRPHGVQKTKLPDESTKVMQFSNYTLCHKVPFTIYCDFESYIVPINNKNVDSLKKTNIAKHIPSGFCYVIVNSEGKAIKYPEIYTGPDVVDTLLNRLLVDANDIQQVLKENKPLLMSLENERDFSTAHLCHLCEKPLADDRVRNHDHISGKYLGAAHNECNLNYKVPKHIPVFFHNLKGYDSHHLLQGFGKYKNDNITCIATTSERYISITLNSLRFTDSLQFLNASLETLVGNLAADGISKFPITQQCVKSNVELLIRKGVFPYSWLTDESKLNETQLPPKESFFNSLTETPVTDDDYAHAQKVWSDFNMKTMRDYHNLYLMSDVLLLADIFEHFRSTSIECYGIDPCNLYSAPGLAWNSMLKMTGVKLELLTDIDQHLFIENGIRGGMAMISHRFAKANNPFLHDFDITQPASYLLPLDATNLYGAALSSLIPQSDFKWLNKEEIKILDVKSISDDADIGYILEVDLHYPEELHNLHSDYPLAPERKVVTEDMLSPYSKKLMDKLDIKPSKTKKLLSTLNDKEKYIVHYRNLKLYLEMGLELKTVHRVMSFKQSAWLAPFINFNTEKRKNAKNKFEENFFKLMNNSTYGKSMENVRSRIDFKLVTSENKLIKWAASPRLKTFFSYNEDLAGLALKKQTVLLNKPIYIGFTVLDISKLIMFNFHYTWAVAKYGTSVKLCTTDTDSLFYWIRTSNVYEDMKEDIELFDMSDYPKDHSCFTEKNKKNLEHLKMKQIQDRQENL